MARKRDTLLRDAIADAKAVRETALANAKAALEEAFTPHLTSMLSARLREELEDDTDDDLEEINDPIPAADGHGTGVDGGQTDKDAIERSSFTEAAVEVGDGVKSDSDLDSSGIASPETQKWGSNSVKEPDNDTRTASDIDNDDRLGMNEGDFDDEYDDDSEDFGMEEIGPGEYGEDDEEGAFGFEEEGEFGGNQEFGGDDEDELGIEQEGEFDSEEDSFDEAPPEDLDLESIIRELEADLQGGDGEDDEFDINTEDDSEFGDDEDEYMGEELSLATHTGAADGHGTDEKGKEDKEAITKSTFTENDDFGYGDDEEEIDLEEILREIEDEEEEDGLAAQNVELQSELKEYRTAVKFLRSKLNEVNLLNAKLLFTNRLFKNFNLDVRAKMRVVENFDRASTIRETKLVYTTLAEVFSGKPVSKRVKRTITEGQASRRTKSTRPRSTTARKSQVYTPAVLAEGKELAARFQKLAGITKR